MKLLFKLGSVLISVLGALLAGMIFKQIWRLVAGEDDAPDADDFDRTWREVLVAAMLQGAIVGFVKAATHRYAARSVLKATGTWPGDDDGSERGRARGRRRVTA
ncbi:DUF4235 domain-containing protein [Actinomadura sp. 21ATH]|uniref:DUF4235 domain-containing protein n=1 Tax=Actinomadura sp. 21ATH TaxID=1735444 RepID=UPI0035C07869